MASILTPEGWKMARGHELRSCPSCHQLMEVREPTAPGTDCIFCALGNLHRALIQKKSRQLSLREYTDTTPWLRRRCERTTRLRLVAAIENEKVAMAAAGGASRARRGPGWVSWRPPPRRPGRAPRSWAG